MWPPAHARSLLSQLSARDDDDCTSGTQFYRCGSNGFRGCCSVDPCDREDCPDSPTLPSVYVSNRIGRPTELPTFVIPNRSTTSEETTSTTTTDPETTTSATSTTEDDEGSDAEEETSSGESSTTTTKADEEPTTFSTSLRDATTEIEPHTTSLEAASTSTLASATKEPGADEEATGGGDAGLSQAQIGGIVGGVVFLLLLISILAVSFFWRRARKRKTQHQESNDSPAAEGKDKTMSLMGSPDSQDPFAPFGGRVDNGYTAVHELDTAEELLPELPGQHEYSDTPASRPPIVPPTASGRVQFRYRVHDPRATLNGTVNDEGRPAYVNHWSQYQ